MLLIELNNGKTVIAMAKISAIEISHNEAIVTSVLFIFVEGNPNAFFETGGKEEITSRFEIIKQQWSNYVPAMEVEVNQQ